MSEPLVFMMGEYEAHFPIDRVYARNHMWAMAVSDAGGGDGDRGSTVSEIPPEGGTTNLSTDVASCRWRFGFAAYAVRLLQDVYFLDWDVDVPAALSAGQAIGAIESSKAESSLHAPIDGTLVQWNEPLLKDPTAINVDKYGAGWLFEMSGGGDTLLSPDQYLEHLTAVWEVTQKTIKGQFNA